MEQQYIKYLIDFYTNIDRETITPIEGKSNKAILHDIDLIIQSLTDMNNDSNKYDEEDYEDLLSDNPCVKILNNMFIYLPVYTETFLNSTIMLYKTFKRKQTIEGLL